MPICITIETYIVFTYAQALAVSYAIDGIDKGIITQTENLWNARTRNMVKKKNEMKIWEMSFDSAAAGAAERVKAS